MSIAQHFVAGEGESHSYAIQPSLSTDAINLPWVILRAVHQASRLEGIPRRARAVLAALARTVNAARPYGEIFARRELLTERAMQSERTFYRSLADLETAGLIERPAQRRYVQAGLFGRSYLHLTEHAAILLGLVERPAPDAVAEGFTTPTASMADGAICKDLSPIAFQKRQPGQVPADLQRLGPLGFRDYLIFKLMREAREQGKRLSEIVEATWEHLRQATRPICYLRALLRSATDFGYAVRSRAAIEAAEQTAIDERRKALSLVAASAGHSFVNAAGDRELIVSPDGTTLTVHQAGEGAARHATGNWQLGFAKALSRGQLQLVPLQAKRSSPTRPQAAAAPRLINSTVAEHLATLRGLVRRA
ncbi:hypothetical protein [Caballeronia humi]|uniref:Replication protein O n=1 Tax=Caballeronia humi TaxID=326474 RepID=A0A158JGX9_9BURK|nr:hypothetical protein [Caballeronia humi]SAL67661.1 hypothetical protein AWB65_06562 [Caballeronia humi]